MVKNVKLFSKQLEALRRLQDPTTNLVLYGGGSRGGKSWLGNLWIMMETFAKPNSAWLVARSNFTDLRDTTMLTFFKVLKHYGVAEHFKHDAQKNITTNISTGSTIKWREMGWYPSDPEYDRIGSNDLTGAFIDECQQVKKKAIDVLRGRFSELSGEGWETIPKMFMSCNPAKNWIMQDFVKPFDEGELSEDKAFISSLVTDNPHVPQAYIDNLRKADKVTRERLLFGNFYYDDDPSKLIEYDKILDLWTNTHVEKGNKYITCDIATKGSDRFVVMVWDGFRVIKVHSEGKSTGKSIIDTIEKLKNDYKIPNSNIVYDADGVGGGLSGFINNANEFVNGSKAKMGENYNHLKSQCYFKLAEKVNEGLVYICDTKHKQAIIEELEYVKRDNVDKDGKLSVMPKDKVKEHLGRSPDFTDTLMMRFYFEVQGSINAFNPNFF
jgi:hypothetical protein